MQEKFKFFSMLLILTLFSTKVTALENNSPINDLSGNWDEQIFETLEVPENAVDLQFSIVGNNGDADLYVKFDSAPSIGSFDCRPYLSGSNETCYIDNVNSGTYHLMVRAYRPFNALVLLGSYIISNDDEGEGENIDVSGSIDNPIELEKGLEQANLSGIQGARTYFILPLTADVQQLNLKTFGGLGDADLYVSYNQIPSTTEYDCRPYRNGNSELCDFENGLAGNYYILIHGYTDFSNVNLIANYNDGSSEPIEPGCISVMNQALLDAHNAARSQGRSCGTEYFPAVPALQWSCQLKEAATAHNLDMIENQFFDHTGFNGSSPGDRINATGYNWRAYGENIAAGYNNVPSVMTGWLNSPGHCRNIMSPSVTEVGAADTDSSTRTYWTTVFSRPQ